MQTGTTPPQPMRVVEVVLDVVGVLVELDELVEDDVLELLLDDDVLEEVEVEVDVELVVDDEVEVDVELDVDAAVVLVGAPVDDVEDVEVELVDVLEDDEVEELLLVDEEVDELLLEVLDDVLVLEVLVEDVEVLLEVDVDVEVELLVDEDELDDEDDDVLVVEDVDVVDGVKFAAKPRICRIWLLPSVPSSHVVTNRSSFVIGSISIPMGRFVKPLANAASVGVSTVPNGRPVAGSMSIRRITIPSKLV
jgi:hypothetical protein